MLGRNNGHAPQTQDGGKASGSLTLLTIAGEKGVVNANVTTVDAVIMGTYEGNMVASGNVEIAETGRVSGNIQTDSLVISKGGFFNGNVTKINDDAEGRPVDLVDDERGPQAELARR